MIPPQSPSLLIPPTQRAANVRRLNWVPMALVMMVIAIALGAVIYTLYHKNQQAEITAKQEAETSKIHGSQAPASLSAAAAANATINSPALPIKTPPPPTTSPAAPIATPGTAGQPGPSTTPPQSAEDQARLQAWQVYWQSRAQQVQAHNQLEQQTYSGSMDPLSSSGGGTGAQTPPTTSPDEPPGGPLAGTDAEGHPQYSHGGVNERGQTGKQAFLDQAGDVYGTNEDVKGSVHGPKAMTIMEGTPLPARTVDAATSDSPGQLVAEISTNVYDDMTGNHLLIPQGTRIITKYDTAVSIGQERIGVIAQRLIFPDTSSRQLGSMQVADMTGEAGVHDVLNTHFWEKFGTALTIAVIGAGVQLSQPQQSAFATPSGTSAATGAFTQQMSQFGIQQAQGALNIPNTIELRPGLQILVKLNKDLTLPAYIDHRNATPSMTFGKIIQ